MSHLFFALFAVTVFTSAFLIFVVQPMVGKHILPWFGGAPAVWNLCLAFYQLALFAGYAYAHWLTAHVRASRQLLPHLLLFGAALAALPVLPDASWKPLAETHPSTHILLMLAVNVGLPFTMLAATGPLMQAWFARAFPGRSPYGLYAVSNAGSLLALLSYPFLIEPWMPLSLESRVWSWLFAACGLAILACASLSARGASTSDASSTEGKPSPPSAEATHTWLWILLPACAVTLFMGVTNKLCLDIASIPFLWLIPLSIYLLTFILCFGAGRFYSRRLYMRLSALSVALMILAHYRLDDFYPVLGGAYTFFTTAAIYSLALFSSCMVIHGELYNLRPAPERLTQYYLCISGGGALGGLFVSILAPQLFADYYELPLGLVASGALIAWIYLKGSEVTLESFLTRKAIAIASVVVALALGYLATRIGGHAGYELLYQERNFFGVLRVYDIWNSKPSKRYRQLQHGTTTHGLQPLAPEARGHPTTYFGTTSGLAFAMQQRREGPIKVGVLGLGVGTIAAYALEGDHFKFYEIDPEVIRMSYGLNYFSYLSDSAADVSVILGDGRLSLETQLRNGDPQNFDMLIMDAFASDSIPVHLLTREAFDLYLQHLKPDGTLVVQITNGYIDLMGLVFRTAKDLGFHAVKISSPRVQGHFHEPADWVILNRDAAYIDSFQDLIVQRRNSLGMSSMYLNATYPNPVDLRHAPVWTDDYSNLYSVLKIGD